MSTSQSSGTKSKEGDEKTDKDEGKEKKGSEESTGSSTRKTRHYVADNEGKINARGTYSTPASVDLVVLEQQSFNHQTRAHLGVAVYEAANGNYVSPGRVVLHVPEKTEERLLTTDVHWPTISNIIHGGNAELDTEEGKLIEYKLFVGDHQPTPGVPSSFSLKVAYTVTEVGEDTTLHREERVILKTHDGKPITGLIETAVDGTPGRVKDFDRTFYFSNQYHNQHRLQYSDPHYLAKHDNTNPLLNVGTFYVDGYTLSDGQGRDDKGNAQAHLTVGGTVLVLTAPAVDVVGRDAIGEYKESLK